MLGRNAQIAQRQYRIVRLLWNALHGIKIRANPSPATCELFTSSFVVWHRICRNTFAFPSDLCSITLSGERIKLPICGLISRDTAYRARKNKRLISSLFCSEHTITNAIHLLTFTFWTVVWKTRYLCDLVNYFKYKECTEGNTAMCEIKEQLCFVWGINLRTFETVEVKRFFS